MLHSRACSRPWLAHSQRLDVIVRHSLRTVPGSGQCSSTTQKQRQAGHSLVCQAAASAGPDPAGTKKQLPIFPLNVVALPTAVVPLMIFEARYRVLFNTLLAGSEKIEDGLVQEDSPFAGSRRFGMCFVDDSGRVSAIGTTLEIKDFLVEGSGRMYVTNKGMERFRVTNVVKQKPVLVCDVEVLPEDDDQSDEAKALAAQVADLFRNVLRLHLKISGAKPRQGANRGSSAGDEALNSEAEDEVVEAAELTELSPSQLSYWIAHAFSDSRMAQQGLLELDKTMERLQEEKALLESTLKYYSAASALEGVFGGVGGSSAGAKGTSQGAKGSTDGTTSQDTSEGSKGTSEGSKGASEVQPPPGGPD